MKTNIRLALILFLCIVPNLVAQQLERYEGTLSIDKERQLYAAVMDVYFESFSENDTVKFTIQGGTEIKTIESKGVAVSYTITGEKEVWGSREKTILIPVKNIFQKKLHISYTNGFEEIKNPRFQYNPDWIEFNIYINWFPWNINYGLFDYSIKIETEDTVIGANLSQDKLLTSPVKTFDIPFVVSDKAQSKLTDNKKIKLYHHKVSDTIVEKVTEKSEQYFAYFAKAFGQSNAKELTIVMYNSGRDLNYARPQFISLDLNKRFTKTDDKTLAHEIGHLWWNKADLFSWEDWLNEAFAEYSAILMYRLNYGQKAFDEYLGKMEAKLIELELPVLWGIDKSHPKSNTVMTYKGAHYLCKLEDRIGKEQMISLMNTTHSKNIKSTSEFLNVLSEVQDESTANWFEKLLKQ